MKEIPDGATQEILNEINKNLKSELDTIQFTIQSTIDKIREEKKEDRTRFLNREEKDPDVLKLEKKLEHEEIYIKRQKKKIVKAKNQLRGAFDLDRVTTHENELIDLEIEFQKIQSDVDGLKQ